jgi:hypothetical protein
VRLARLAFPVPDEEPYKAVRRGLLACAKATGCALVPDLPGFVPAVSHTADAGSVHVVSLQPKEGTALAPGQQVTVVARHRYELEVDEATIKRAMSSATDSGATRSRGSSGAQTADPSSPGTTASSSG